MKEKSEERPNKKISRLHNRKRKLEAFFNVALLNDNEREQVNKKSRRESTTESSKKKKRKDYSRKHRANKRKEIAKLMEASKNVLSKERDEGKTAPLSDESYKKIKCILGARKKVLKSQPRFWIREHGLTASLDLPFTDRVPLFVGDVQHLVLFALLGNSIHQEHNRWCHLDRHGLVSQVVVLILEGTGAGDLLKPLKPTKKSGESAKDAEQKGKSIAHVFSNAVELVNPETYDRSLVDDFCLVPLSARMCRIMFQKYGSKEAELKSRMFRAAFPINVVVPKQPEEESKSSSDQDAAKQSGVAGDDVIASNKETKKSVEKKKVSVKEVPTSSLLPPTDKFPRTELVLSPSQLVQESYPIPIGQWAYTYQHYVYTKDHYTQLTPSSPMFGLDCEMCLTTIRRNELTRVSVVDENHQPVYETLVLPRNPIIDYLTQFSGITPQMLRGVRTRLEDVQADLRRLLPPDAILVGQSLNSDLHAIEMFHPYCIDSSVIFNINGRRRAKTKLKTLSEMFLGEKIQQGTDGHDSIEDSLAALKLVQLKLTKSLDFGDTVLGFDLNKIQSKSEEVTESKSEEVIESPEDKEDEEYKHPSYEVPQPEVIKVMEASSLFKLAARTKKVGVFGVPEVLSQYSKYLSGHHEMAGTKLAYRAGSHGIEAETNYKVVKKLLRDSAMFDLSVAHLKLDINSEKNRARAINTCLKVAEGVQEKGMVIVLAGGRPNSGGHPDKRPACFVHLNVPGYSKL